MKPIYITVAGTPVVHLMNNEAEVFRVTIRAAAGQTVEAALEDVQNKDTAPNSPGPTWFALTPSVTPNVYQLEFPVRLFRFTGPGVATILQQGH